MKENLKSIGIILGLLLFIFCMYYYVLPFAKTVNYNLFYKDKVDGKFNKLEKRIIVIEKKLKIIKK